MGSLGGTSEELAVGSSGRVADKADSAELCEPEACPLEWESPSSEKLLLALLARLLRSFPVLEPADELPPALPSASPAWVGLSRSKPNCSKDRLNDVVFAGRVRCN